MANIRRKSIWPLLKSLLDLPKPLKKARRWYKEGWRAMVEVAGVNSIFQALYTLMFQPF